MNNFFEKIKSTFPRSTKTRIILGVLLGVGLLGGEALGEEPLGEEEDDDDKDADFKEVIFPQIIDIVKRELSNNIDTEKSKRIVFCSSYLQAHLSDLPVKYTENNYKLLF